MNSFILQSHFGDFYTEKKSDGKFHAINHFGNLTTEIVSASLRELKQAVLEVRE